MITIPTRSIKGKENRLNERQTGHNLFSYFPVFFHEFPLLYRMTYSTFLINTPAAAS
jgi:hypothetical protein